MKEEAGVKLSQTLYARAEKIWPRYLCHPFVTQMADGTLPPEKFRYYMLQDYLYLKDYVKIFAAIIQKADDFEQIRFLSGELADTIGETFRTHIPYMKRLGITEEEIHSARPHMDNNAYTHYMLWEAQTGDVLTGLVTLLNCSWSYAYVAEKIVERCPDALRDKRYGSWFAGYVSESYRRTNQMLIDRIDALSGSIDDKTTAHLCEIFEKCCLFDLRFWDMVYAMVATESSPFDTEVSTCKTSVSQRKQIIAIANSHISGRKLGAPLTNMSLSILRDKSYERMDYHLHYYSINVNGKDLRSSTFFIKDSGELIGLLCINFDDSRYRDVCDRILSLCHPDLFVTDVLAQPLPENEDGVSARSSPEKFRNSADAVALDAINRELERMGVTPEQLTPEKRLQVIAALESGGLFLLKGAVKSAAASLHCSPASVYRYITQIKNSDNGQI